MRYGKVISAAIHGIDGILVEIEIALLPGLPGFEIVGLGDSAIRESRNRIQAAIRSSGFEFPVSKVTASLAPAWLRKEGSGFDLPIAMAILLASGQCKPHKQFKNQLPAMMGELSLDGKIRSIPGVFNRVATCADEKISRLMVPQINYAEACAVEALNSQIIPICNLRQCVEIIALDPSQTNLNQTNPGKANTGQAKAMAITDHDLSHRCGNIEGVFSDSTQLDQVPDISMIVGQKKAVRALTIAAAGWHHLLMLGSPGSGKTSLAATIPGILPPLDRDEARLVTRIHSAAGQLNGSTGLIRTRPYCAPHFSVTRAALIGGGNPPVPGLCSLAHGGVLFLDELTQIDSRTLDVLRQPLESHQVNLSRLKTNVNFPADFLFIAAANPCQCGEFYEPGQRCRCTKESVARYLGKISGPMLDRIDLTVDVIRPRADLLRKTVSRQLSVADQPLLTSDMIRQQIASCWAIQHDRCRAAGVLPVWNGRIQHAELAHFFKISPQVLDMAQRAAEKLRLSVRSFQKILRVARSIADLDQLDQVTEEHLFEAIQFRLRQMEGGQADV